MKNRKLFNFTCSMTAMVLTAGLLSFGCGGGHQGTAGQSGDTTGTDAAAGNSGASLAFDFALADLQGKVHRLSDYRGKVVLLDFWDTWCGPCKMEIPGFVELQNQYGDQGLQIIGIALAAQGREVVAKFASEYKIQYPTLLKDTDVLARYGGINSIPTTFLIDREGKIVEKWVGYHPKEFFDQKIKAQL